MNHLMTVAAATAAVSFGQAVGLNPVGTCLFMAVVIAIVRPVADRIHRKLKIGELK